MTTTTATTHCDLGDHGAPTAGMIRVDAQAGYRPLTICADCRERYLDEARLRAEAPEAITHLDAGWSVCRACGSDIIAGEQCDVCEEGE